MKNRAVLGVVSLVNSTLAIRMEPYAHAERLQRWLTALAATVDRGVV